MDNTSEVVADTSDDEHVSLDSEEEQKYLHPDSEPEPSGSPSAATPSVPEGVIKQGQLEVKDSKKGLTLGKTKWGSRWVIIVKGTMHLYKNFEVRAGCYLPK